MTRKEIESLSGRKLDRAVAKLLGDYRGKDGWWHSFDGSKHSRKGGGPAEYSKCPVALARLKTFMAREFWWEIKSPFFPGQLWFAGLTRHQVTGWNGRPDWRSAGVTEAIACCRAALLTLGEPQL